MNERTRTGRSESATEGRARAVFVLEQTLGHITHTKNLRALVPADRGIDPTFVLVPFEPAASRVPGWSNWTVRAGIRANARLVDARRRGVRPDVLFVHTQVPAVLLGGWMRRTPTVVSIDATPIQYDELGEFYAHAPGHPRVEALKFRANQRCFERAAHLVSWSQWGKSGLADGYGVDPAKVTVISPGVDVDLWAPPDSPDRPDGAVRILFVGGDLKRKGGDLLIDAVRALRADPAVPPVELHLVTNADVAPEPGIEVHQGLTSNSAELIEQYHRAGVFCLPTLGDCLPMVLAEAAAAGLPLVSTDVGAIREIVHPGVTGELVPPGDLGALVAALRLLVGDTERRRRFGSAARELAADAHNARTNAGRLADLLNDVAGGRR